MGVLERGPLLGLAGHTALLVLLASLLVRALMIAVIGLALWPLAGVPLVVCLLLGSIVATTDPASGPSPSSRTDAAGVDAWAEGTAIAARTSGSDRTPVTTSAGRALLGARTIASTGNS